MNTISTQREERGFAMLFAVLTASVLLSIGLSIFNLTIKELALSSSGRESQAAFFAADSGIECALYWDVVGTVFASSSESGASPSFSCAGQAVTVAESRSSGAATTTFSFSPTNATTGALPCAYVSVGKYSSGGQDFTSVISRGYNVGYVASEAGANKCVGTDSLKVERALRITY